LATSAALPNGVVGVPYTFTLLVRGGTPPYSWIVVDGALPSGLALNPTSGVLAGTPAANGTFNFSVRVRDSAQMTATFAHSLVVAAPTLPEISISGLPAEVQPLQQLSINLDLSVPYPLSVNGTLNLSFTPLGGSADDPSIQFSTGGRSAAFSIAANSTRATFGASQFAIQTGSVAGTIRLSISSLQSAGSSISLPVNPIQPLQLNPAPPSIRRITLVRTNTGIDVQLTALSDTRELTEAQVTFQPAPGSSLETPVLTVPLTNLARTWFQSGDSIPFGGQVQITLPFTFTGSVSLNSVAVTLANGMGKSVAATANN
jgi:Putative Ig domain